MRFDLCSCRRRNKRNSDSAWLAKAWARVWRQPAPASDEGTCVSHGYDVGALQTLQHGECVQRWCGTYPDELPPLPSLKAAGKQTSCVVEAAPV